MRRHFKTILPIRKHSLTLGSGNTVMSHKCSVLSRKTGKSNVVYYRFRPWERILPGGLSELDVCQEGKVGKRNSDKHLEHGGSRSSVVCCDQTTQCGGDAGKGGRAESGHTK